MTNTARYPSFRWSTILLAMLSLSIGWGIRGDYGHEAGAMMPGMLCAVAVCLASGREDWRRRVLFFALFGALGWGFGGSISYMVTMGYTQCGNLASELYGWFTVFLVGFLWAGMGGAGTAYAAVESRERLTAIYRPLCWVLAAWAIQYFCMPEVTRWLAGGATSSDFRQRTPFYWLDSVWMPANFSLLGLCLFELWDRRFRQIHLLAIFGAGGAAIGWGIQQLLLVTGWMGPFLSVMVHRQGDLSAINPATGQPFDPNNMVTNWPQLFFDWGPHMGWIFGLILGLAIFFYRYGQWRAGSSLLMHITVGSYVVFLIGPVFLTNFFMSVGGFRLTPPRGDSWANIVGCFIGMFVYMWRNKLKPVAYAAVISGLIGGLGFMVAQFCKILAWMPGNPILTQNPAVIAAWQYWRSANWHNIAVEQGVGLFYGLAIAISMGLLAMRQKPIGEEPRMRKWTEYFSVFFVLNVLIYINMVKNLGDWTALHNGFRSVPLSMRAPLFGWIEFSALGWFNIFYVLMTICTVALLVAHYRHSLAVIPKSWTGKGQALYLMFLWVILVGNWEKALVAFHEQRLATEWTMAVNGLIATFLFLYFVRDDVIAPPPVESDFRLPFRRAIVYGLAGLIVGMFAFTGIFRAVYGGSNDHWTSDTRFGPNADWRVHPLLKTQMHR